MNFLSTITGCFAQPAAENPTVAMVEAAYRAAGLDARYLNCEVAPADLGDAVRGARAMGWAGFNCSLPHKVAVIAHLDELAPSAAIIGAVNCVVRQRDRLIGENTDGQGFLASLRSVVDPAGKHVVVVLGAGVRRGRSPSRRPSPARPRSPSSIVDRRRGGELAGLLDERTPTAATFVPWDEPYRLPESTDIVVNATPVGLYPDVDARVDLDVDSLRPRDDRRRRDPQPAVHAPAPRRQRLAAAGPLDGLGMLVNQGVLGIKLWTGVDADSAVMYETLRRVARRLSGSLSRRTRAPARPPRS